MNPRRAYSQPDTPVGPPASPSNRRLQAWFAILVLILAVFMARLFYLQIIKHDYYRQQALSDQQKQYVLPASRGIISAHSGGSVVPIVLNHQVFTLFADPTLIRDAPGEAGKLAAITGGKASDYLKSIKAATGRYQVLAQQLSQDQQKKISALELPGIGLQPNDVRVYPQGSLASQILGFVNSSGQGSYGIEQYFNSQLAGTPGQLKAVTDVNGIPLAAGKDNVEVDPKPGQNVTLTIDVSMQKQLEKILHAGLLRDNSQSGSVLIMDPNTGQVKAMANEPTYDPSKYYKVKDPSVFQNANVSSDFEPGSIMKVLTTAAALDQHVIKPTTTYNDPGSWMLDGQKITNVDEVGAGPGRHSIYDILQLSLNTGATWMMMQMGGGQINQQARDRWHDYLVNHYQFGKSTGIEQGYEAAGSIPDPRKGYALELTYANMSFGQGMTMTTLQIAAALSSVINGGTYYKPTIVDRMTDASGRSVIQKPKVVKRNVVSSKTSLEIRQVMEYMIAHHIFVPAFPPHYGIGGKTGTPQVPNPAGGYYTDRTNGTYLGFVGGSRPQYVIVVRVNSPHVGTFAGVGAAQPIFGDIAHMLINNFNVLPKR